MMADAAVEAVRIVIRPEPADSYSAVGTLRNLNGYYGVVTHSGVTLAPYLGRAVADEILHGKKHDLLASFRPDRFFN
ncbi:FAD-binding oxidoreductase, partial [Paraburkholderia aspalathi]|nr:FAD-binding oxidoreductase [Paraburkholderia aspalathi]